MKGLSVDNITLFHEKIIRETGGSSGIRDKGLIESAVNRALMTYDGKDLYPGIVDKIAVTAYSLISNHGFVDGNKRIGIAVLLLLLRVNDIEISYTQKELIELGLGIAEGRIKEIDIFKWIKDHSIE